MNSEPVILKSCKLKPCKINKGKIGDVKSILQYINSNNKINNKEKKIPIWLIIVFSYLAIATLTILGSTIYVSVTIRPALYNESCVIIIC